MAHDGETYFEYNDLEQSILDQKQFDNLSYYILYYNQKYKYISVKSTSQIEGRRCLADLPETANFANDDFYKRATLVKFLQFVKGKEAQETNDNADDISFHYLVMTWGHGGGLFYFPNGKFEELLRKFNLLLNQNGENAETIKREIHKNLFAYTQASCDISNTNGHGANEGTVCSLSKKTYRNVMGIPLSKVDDTVDNNLAAFNKEVAEISNFYTATDMNAIFTDGLGKVDVYFALNCFTQMIDTGYELRNSVNMMVAPQTTMPLPGINYKEVFATLENEPGISLTSLAKVIVSSFPQKYTAKFLEDFMTRYPIFKLHMRIVSFSCNFLQDYEQLVDCLNDLTELLKKIYNQEDLKLHIVHVSEARELCGDLTPDNNYGLIDLNNFVVQLQAKLPGIFTQEITAIREKLEGVKKLVLADIKTPEPDAEDATSGSPQNNPSFLSFFAPAFFEGQEGVWRRLLDVYPHMKNEFSKRSKWVGFVNDFFDNTFPTS